MAAHRHFIRDVDVSAQTAVCKSCGPVDVYFRANKGIWACRNARREAYRAYAEKRPKTAEQKARYKQDARLRRFGLTPAEFDAMLSAQNGRCAICRDRPTDRQLAIDHNHATGAVRGLLCSPCNRALGMFRDDQKRLAAAIQYLQQSQ